MKYSANPILRSAKKMLIPSFSSFLSTPICSSVFGYFLILTIDKVAFNRARIHDPVLPIVKKEILVRFTIESPGNAHGCQQLHKP